MSMLVLTLSTSAGLEPQKKLSYSQDAGKDTDRLHDWQDDGPSGQLFPSYQEYPVKQNEWSQEEQGVF